MESALRPREIQSRIRAGQSVTEVAEAAGVPETRIEPYALPVLAEREHIAALATRSSVRRRGETMGHRNLKATVDERLTACDVDPGLVTWDSARTPDGRWAVSASVPAQSGDPAETKGAAIFLFDVAGRFSIAGNDEARLVLGDMPPDSGARAPGQNTGETAGEPLVDPGDELAIVRALQEPPTEPAAPTAAAESEVVEVIEVVEVEVEVNPALPPSGETSPESAAADARPAVPVSPDLDMLYDMLSDRTEDSVRIYRGPDGEGVVETAPAATWTPEIVVDEPIGSVPDTPDDSPSDDTSEQELAQENQVPAEPEHREANTVLAPDRRPAPASEDQAEPALMPEPKQSRQPASRKRKRASVPSWDEIMFGGPKPH